MTKLCHIISGGTVFHVRPHLALSAPAYGRTGRLLEKYWEELPNQKTPTILWQTHMAGGSYNLETNNDVSELVANLVENERTKIIFMPVALCDFTGEVGSGIVPEGPRVGKQAPRLSSAHATNLYLTPAPKIISSIRKTRKDIFLVGFKTTTGLTEDEQFKAGLKLLKTSSCNLVLANDLHTRMNMIITPEEARYSVTTHRLNVLKELVEMTWLRSQLTFTRSTVVDGYPVPWDNDLIPSNLRIVVDGMIARKAYKPGPTGATVGHFATKLDDQTFLTSIRKTNFNDISKLGMVLVKTDSPDSVIAYGSRPSVGGQSQRIVFKEHPGMDCIVHAHVPIREGSKVPQVSQREYECGSHQCGQNTSSGLGAFTLSNQTGSYSIRAVYLQKHGPNVVFSKDTPAELVLKFIEENFDLARSTSQT